MAKKAKLTLTPEAHAELEAILGPRNITSDRAMMSGYAWETGVGKIAGEKKFAAVWPVAVVLPASTEEVAAVVKACVRHGLSYRASSTGYGSMAGVMSEGSIAIDLRRMDHLEVLPEERMAIIGPYATANQLQAEARKHGLACHVVGAGPAHSPLASASSLIGVGITSNYTSANMRNLLAWEWVTPEGEIIRGGSAGQDMGWFASDGPGPGSRGLIRGFLGGGGGLGVFTKIGIKLFPINQSGPIKTTGSVPQIGAPLPPHTSLLIPIFPDYEAMTAATFELFQDDLCHVLLRIPPDHIGWTITGSNAEFVKATEDGTLPEFAQNDKGAAWMILLAARSEAEHTWRDSAVREVVAQHGGHFSEVEQAHAEVLYHNLMTSQYVPRVLRASGGITTSYGVLDSFSFMPKSIDQGEAMLEDGTKPGGDLAQGAPEEFWIWPHEGRYMWGENIIQFDPSKIESREAAAKAFFTQFSQLWSEPAGVSGLFVGPIQDVTGERVGKAARYGRKVKTAFDPNNHSRSKEHVIPGMPPLVEKTLPKLRPVFGSKPAQKVLSKLIAKNGM